MRLRLRARKNGQAAIETTVVAFFLLILLLGVIGFGQILQASVRLETAAREGARVATNGGDNDQIRQEILRNLSKTGDVNDVPGAVAIGLDPDDIGQRVFNSEVTVEVWWRYPIPVALFNLLVKERELYARKRMVVTIGN